MSTGLMIALGITLAIALLLIKFNTVSNPAVAYRKMLVNIRFDCEQILTRDIIRQRFEKVQLSGCLPDIEPLFRDEILIKPTLVKEEDLLSTDSKIGGYPYMKQDFAAPFGQLFIAQIHCAELSAFDAVASFPRVGMLYFFLDIQKLSAGDSSFIHIIHTDTENLVWRKDIPIMQETVAWLAFFPSVSLPSCNDLRIGKLMQEYQIEGYFKATNTFNCHKIGGYPDSITDATLPEDEMLLLQLDTDDSIGMLWEEMGRLYVFIGKEEFQNGNFKTGKSFLQSYREEFTKG
jgi:uncharacterized protein YwqG